MTVSTGLQTLDEALDGGLPESRTVLATGTPGTGKSTLAMQFLQAGLREGERCLYISTEQTLNEIRDSFAAFDFDLDHEDLAVTSLHIRPGSGTEDYEGRGITRTQGGGGGDGGTGMVLRTLEGGKKLDGHNIRFSSKNVRSYLKQGADGVDRVVVDSVTGLRPIADDDVQYRRVVLDLIQLFNSDLDATTLFTAESSGAIGDTGVEQLAADDAVQFNVHGVIRLWREQVGGSYRRFLDIMKMRGVAHDTRRYEIRFAEDGLQIVPRTRTPPMSRTEPEYLPTNIEGLDGVMGGGFIHGQTALLEHDGQASIEPFLYGVSSNAVDQRMSLVLVPRVDTPKRFLTNLFETFGASMEKMLDNDQLFVFDPLQSWGEQRNVFDLEPETVEDTLEMIRDRARGDGIMAGVTSEALVHTLGADMARELRYWMQAQFLRDNDVLFDVLNPGVIDDDLAAFYRDASSQVLETWLSEHGLQYVKFRKGPGGEIGTVRLLEYLDEPPFVRAV